MPQDLSFDLSGALNSAQGKQSVRWQGCLPAGQVTLLSGESGSGKTTLIRALCGLDSQVQGLVTWGKQVWQTQTQYLIPLHQRNIGMMMQHYALFPHQTVRNQLLFAHADKKRAHELLDIMGLTQLADSRPAQLSGGQQQRLALARTLMRRPPLVCLDEPFSALDPDRRRQLLNWLQTEHQQRPFSLLVITHDLEDWQAFAHEHWQLQQGILTKKAHYQLKVA